MKGRVAVLAGTVLLALASGCATAPVGSAPATTAFEAPRIDDPGYVAAFKRSTRSGADYDGLERRLFAAATLESRAFRAARVHATAGFLHLSDEETGARLEAERLEAERYVEFMVGLSTAERRWNDLGQPGSIWRVELEAGGARLLPTSVQRIDRPDANTVALYRYLTPFWVAYRVRFPLVDPAGAPLVLRLASSVGRVELEFEGDPAPANR